MTLNEFVAERRNAIYEALVAGKEPAGEFDPQMLREARTKGKPQMGSTRFDASSVVFEFIYPDARAAAAILDVRVASPDRIIFLPVPPWVIEQIWQGEVTGSFHFATQARAMIERLAELVDPKT